MRGRKWILDRTDDGAKAPSARPIRVIEKQNTVVRERGRPEGEQVERQPVLQ